MLWARKVASEKARFPLMAHRMPSPSLMKDREPFEPSSCTDATRTGSRDAAIQVGESTTPGANIACSVSLGMFASYLSNFHILALQIPFAHASWR